MAKGKISVAVISGGSDYLTIVDGTINKLIAASAAEISFFDSRSFISQKNGAAEKKFDLVIITGIILGGITAVDLAGRFPEEKCLILCDHDTRHLAAKSKERFGINAEIIDISGDIRPLEQAIAKFL